MKKLLVMSLVFCLVLALSSSVLSKKPKSQTFDEHTREKEKGP